MSPALTLSVPTEPAFSVVVRTAAASLAARAGATIDGVEDARGVAAELLALAIDVAPAGGTAVLAFAFEGSDISVELRTPSAAGDVPSTQSFAWTILEGLTSDLHAEVIAGPTPTALLVRCRIRVSVPA